MVDEPVNQNEDQVDESQTQGNEPEAGSERDGTAELENGGQDTTDSRDDAVAEGHETARENAEQERDDQPAPEGE